MNPRETSGFSPARTPQTPRPAPHEGRQTPSRRKRRRGPRHSAYQHLPRWGAASHPASLSRGCGVPRRIQTPVTSYRLNKVFRALWASRALPAPFCISEQDCLPRKQNAVGSLVEAHPRCRRSRAAALCRAGLGYEAGRTMSGSRRDLRVLHPRTLLQADSGHLSPGQPSYAERRCQRPHTHGST